jgi:hypothetical protein
VTDRFAFRVQPCYTKRWVWSALRHCTVRRLRSAALEGTQGAHRTEGEKTIEYTVLGRTGFQVSHVGFGGGGIGQVWGPTTEAESVRAIHRGLELGVNFFDVAPAYAHGTAEEVLGRALQGRQEPGVVVTCERDRRTAGVCRPAPDSATASHTSAGTLRPGFPR